MFDAMKLLGSLLEGQATSGRFGAAAQSVGYAPTDTPQQQPAQGGVGSFGAGSLGAVAGALLGKSGPGVIGGGLLGIVGNIALQALQARMAAGSAQGNAAGSAPGLAALPVSAFGTPTPDGQRKATLLLRAMIQSAKADGTIDAVETQRIMAKIDAHGYDPAAHAFVTAEMAKPIDMIGLCRDVTSPQEAVEVYAASLMVIDLDSQAERDYLEDLASNLRLSPQTTAQVHQSLGVA